MFKCPQCGAKNQLGALFCRSCGQKLDMANVEQQLEQQQHGLRGVDWRRLGGILRTLIGLAALVFVVAVGIGLFLPVDTRVAPSISQDEQRGAFAKVEAILDRRPGTYSFTAEEVTALANRLLGLGEYAEGEPLGAEDDGGFALRPRVLHIDLLGSGYARMVLRSTTFKGISVYSTVIARFDVRAGQVIFLPHSVYSGRVRMIGPLKGVILDRFMRLVEGDQLIESLRQRIDFIGVTRGEVEIDVEPSS